jgi:guanylate kinase
MDISAATIASVSDLVDNYQPNPRAAEVLSHMTVILLVGIAGAGKNTIIEQLLGEKDSPYKRIVTCTTRAPRANDGVLEQNDIDYHFLDLKTAQQMLVNKEFIETNIYSSNVYGTALTEFEKIAEEGKIAVGDVDVNGVANMERIAPSIRPIFILPPSFEVWFKRLKDRYGEHWETRQEDVVARIETARQELEYALHAGYFYLVLNDDLAVAVQVVDTVAHDASLKPQDTFSRRALAESLLKEIKRYQQSAKQSDNP